ncbi:MAG: double-strand break repair helicase AddA [Pseudomonadota bacterium]|nr:double-strand break repair helicase AddA [Pseudomonadota bacterium]
MTPLEETANAQRAAADPDVSAFVAANAGAGKTRVLTDRVARLLLAGARPDRVLCITFTKAAAAEMATRLFKLLGEWALADDAKLAEKLAKLEGGERRREARDFAEARRLFARALETPGGLKIQTIHSFCEGVLKRFPLEAGVAPGFSVIEDAEAAALASAAIDQTARRSLTDDGLGDAMRRLAERKGPGLVREMLLSKITGRQSLDAALAATGGWAEMISQTARALGVGEKVDEAAIFREAASLVDDNDMRRLQEALLAGGIKAREAAVGPAAAYLNAASDEGRYEALRSLFLTQGGTPRASVVDKPAKKAAPWAEEFCRDRQESFARLADELKAARIFADTRAFLTLLEAAHAAYEALKASRARLDYDDLIVYARRLFSTREAAAWALYKLDQGLEHILLDEAQDTSPAQWAVVEGPLGEFFAGEGARERRRTFFAVGDQKQSIYSFQGADATLFKAKRADLGKKIAAVAPFVEKPLHLSFRTTAPVLAFVDALFEDADAREGLGEDGPVEHKIIREGEAGLVELWPLTPRPERKEATPWDAPLNLVTEDNPVRLLAGAVAATIREWLDKREPLRSAGRPVAPGDVLILVQSRGALFHEIIRALGETGIPVAGADRLKLLEDAAAEDILSYAETVLLDTDDLSLAETLKSPFFGLTDDDLFTLTRERTGSLWRRLVARADERPEWAKARDEIRMARRVALKEGAYAFLNHILDTGAPSGRRRLYARLGASSRETIDELLRQALDYELKNPRSLQGFLGWARKNAGEIKREMDQASGSARVMTVHGAKGLEAPIVFLLDAHKQPVTSKIGPALELPPPAGGGPPGLFAIAGVKSEDSVVTAAARERETRLHYEEYRRKLYVGATRARDRLYICGIESGNVRDPSAKETSVKTWHALSVDAFNRLGDVNRFPHPCGWGDVLRIETPQTATPKHDDRAPIAAMPPAPAFLFSTPPSETPPLRLAPSRLADDAEAAAEPAAFSPLRARDRFLRGRALHRLLELLPAVEPEKRAAVADRLLQRLAADVDGTERERWRDEVLAVLRDPSFAPVFTPRSRAEVAIAGAPKGARPGIVINGAIDRLAVENGKVLIVDYKTNRPPPARVEEASPAYIAQLAAYRALLQEIYPGHQIDCALLWTYEARLMRIPPALLDHAFKSALA